MAQSNPIGTAHQNITPNSHSKNPSKYYLVQLPQGTQYFSSSRKKQFSNLHHQSEIKQTNLFYEEPAKYDHGTLYVDDIEGALPNTLICQTLKNKMKSNLMKKSRVSQQRNSKNGEAEMRNEFEQPRQRQKSKRLEESNYHILSSRMRTQPIKNFHHQQGHLENPQKDIGRKSMEIQNSYQSIPVAANPPNKIKQLQEMLFAKQEQRLKPILLEEQIRKDQKGHQYPRQQKRDDNYYHRSSKDIVTQRSQDQAKHKEVSRLIPAYEIRRYNPTFLSAANYAVTEHGYHNSTMLK